MDKITEKIIEILKKIKPNVNFDENTKIVDNNLLNSFEMYKFVNELNFEFDIEILPLDIIPQNFNTLSAIKALIEKHQDED